MSVQAVFEHWKITMDHKRAVLDPSRQKAISQALRWGYTVDLLCLAIDGCRASAFHMGENQRGQVYDSLTLILRDADHIDKFIKAGEHAHQIIERRMQEEEHRAAETVERTPEQIQRARDLLATVKLKRVA